MRWWHHLALTTSRCRSQTLHSRRPSSARRQRRRPKRPSAPGSMTVGVAPALGGASNANRRSRGAAMADSKEDTIRRGYKAFGEGDMETFRSIYAPDVV